MKKAFKNSDFEALLDPEVQGLVKNKKWSTKVLKRECNQLLTRGVTGDYYKDFKPQPLFLIITPFGRKMLSKRMLKIPS